MSKDNDKSRNRLELPDPSDFWWGEDGQPIRGDALHALDEDMGPEPTASRLVRDSSPPLEANGNRTTERIAVIVVVGSMVASGLGLFVASRIAGNIFDQACATPAASAQLQAEGSCAPTPPPSEITPTGTPSVQPS